MEQENPEDKKCCQPKKTFSLTRKLMVCFVFTLIVFSGCLFVVMNTVIHSTSTDSFCLSCHEMKDNILTESFKTSIHGSNRTGVKVACADCHIPDEFVPKMIRKAHAVKEVWGHMTGVIDTPEKFDAHRGEMAKAEWARMRANDSQECRNCHDISKLQKKFMAPFHEASLKEGKTCIDCHAGIAHKLPAVSTAAH
ncbi:cytochrome C [Escherichia coli]|uniref:NapC/NirT family cytochrome c n=1 Tax=Escherichia sp. MOD1-EC7003 TaxID=2093900 RepID=UPI000CF7AEA0|nr:NapC/NirT family cytochrome c [Escherichia sp. MOD1-EC7003]EGO8360823.1 cytochrome C [Escherichia coli]EGO8378270.1 cytochrome C [Escherichia coli]MCH0694301.1 NapC/NirT family cytochrome c [Escherichia coli]